ncbi:MAG: hypothetical protein PHW38_05930 [Candidatus Cloacimonetes bacterium]
MENPMVSKLKQYQSLAIDIPDERIEVMLEVSEKYVKQYLGEEIYNQYLDDARLEYAICAIAISKLVIGSRGINEGSSIHRTTGWGEGNIYPSEVNEIVTISRRWEEEGQKILNQLRAEMPQEIGWVDI